LEKLNIIKIHQLRSNSISNLSKSDVIKMLKAKDFFDKNMNSTGEGIHHSYEEILSFEAVLIKDYTTKLMWQKSGSLNNMNFDSAKKFINELNINNFGGYNDWRLPTLEEAMSLVSPKKQNSAYIFTKFDIMQSWIWTSDAESENSRWRVYFYHGYAVNHNVGNGLNAVRAVRNL